MTSSSVVAHLAEQHRRKLGLAKRVTLIGMAASGSLSAAKLLVGWIGHSTAVSADGLENAGDVFGSGLILYACLLHLRHRTRNILTGTVVPKRLQG
jgi:divalent metal cation (Fe/Co/Zn/Cd) transporter